MPRATRRPAAPAWLPVTSRAQILAAARELIDRDGWEKLTVRGLAAETRHRARRPCTTTCGTRTICCSCCSTSTGADPSSRPAGRAAGPHHRGRRRDARAPRLLAVGGRDPHRRRLRRPPGRFGPLAGRGHRGRSHRRGCTPEQAVDVFRGLWYYTVGEALVRARTARRRTPPSGPGATSTSAASTRPGCRGWPPWATSGPRWPRETSTPRASGRSWTGCSRRPRLRLPRSGARWLQGLVSGYAGAGWRRRSRRAVLGLGCAPARDRAELDQVGEVGFVLGSGVGRRKGFLGRVDDRGGYRDDRLGLDRVLGLRHTPGRRRPDRSGAGRNVRRRRRSRGWSNDGALAAKSASVKRQVGDHCAHSSRANSSPSFAASPARPRSPCR